MGERGGGERRVHGEHGGETDAMNTVRGVSSEERRFAPFAPQAPVSFPHSLHSLRRSALPRS